MSSVIGKNYVEKKFSASVALFQVFTKCAIISGASYVYLAIYASFIVSALK